MKVVFFLLCNLILCSLGAQEQRGFPKDLVQNPSVVEKKMNEAVAHFDAGRYEQSLRLLNESIEKNRHEELKDILYYYRAVTKYQLKKYEEAIVDYDTAIAAAPAKDHYYFNRGLAFYAKEDYSKASKDFKMKLKLGKADALTHTKLGLILQQEMDYHGALKHYDKAIALDENYADVYYYRALIMLQVNLPEKGCKDLAKAATLGLDVAIQKQMQYCR